MSHETIQRKARKAFSKRGVHSIRVEFINTVVLKNRTPTHQNVRLPGDKALVGQLVIMVWVNEGR